MQVPVAVTNLPAGSQLHIGCEVISSGSNTDYIRQYVSPGTVAYSGTFAIPITVPAPLVSYTCMLNIMVGANLVNYEQRSDRPRDRMDRSDDPKGAL